MFYYLHIVTTLALDTFITIGITLVFFPFCICQFPWKRMERERYFLCASCSPWFHLAKKNILGPWMRRRLWQTRTFDANQLKHGRVIKITLCSCTALWSKNLHFTLLPCYVKQKTWTEWKDKLIFLFSPLAQVHWSRAPFGSLNCVTCLFLPVGPVKLLHLLAHSLFIYPMNEFTPRADRHTLLNFCQVSLSLSLLGPNLWPFHDSHLYPNGSSNANFSTSTWK